MFVYLEKDLWKNDSNNCGFIGLMAIIACYKEQLEMALLNSGCETLEDVIRVLVNFGTCFNEIKQTLLLIS